ncbi:hypothetical protein U8335_10710 [Roseiconus lacunae]|uniref:hypothetical protein n=1 Tax=Roseiconus lacunae TaxID=2605694 RepID=UPI0030862701|nr:hypothetical protein U8335_10710 [Stieleria sp. HD01]
MELVNQTIRLRSNEDFGTRLPPQHIGHLFVELPKVIRQSVSMAVQNRSSTKGRGPDWLGRASEIRFVGHAADDGVVLRFESARLRDTAPEIFQQQSLFPELMPDGDATGFDMLGDVLADIQRREQDSQHFDTTLLRSVGRFQKFFNRGPFTCVEFANQSTPDRHVELTEDLVATAKSLSGMTPVPQRVRLVGKLDGIEASTQRFSLVLETGDKVTGVFGDAQMDQMQRLWRHRVLVLGSAVYRPSGRLLRIEADEVRDGEGEPSLFSRLPTSRHEKLDASKLKKPQGPRSGMAAIAGAWPGEETDEEIEAALEQLS